MGHEADVEDKPEPEVKEEMDTGNMKEEKVVLEKNRKGRRWQKCGERCRSKLREKKMNKVSALVGAFETVISLESEQSPE
ncbi:hypothetical protein L1887_27642 [Cichorium endivia]|nr:hypothetical protein L1887_27642 [Cichorium endivia]